MSRRLPILFSLLALLASCAGNAVREADNVKEPEKSDLTAEAMHWADSVCRSMSLSQKVGQLFMPSLYASDDVWTMRLIQQYADSCIGGVVLLKGDCEGARTIADSLHARSMAMPFVAIDAEWGLAMRLADAPEFPRNPKISREAGEGVMYDYGYELARECRLLGINMVLGPVVDISGPDSFMLRRSLGDDPVRVADLSLAYARGLEDGNVISVAKHFPGHGSVSADSHKRKGVIDRSLHELDSIDLYPFRKWVEHRLSGVMVGHLAVPAIDSDMRPAAVSAVVIQDLLRDDMGYSGLVLTDALNMKGAEGYSSLDAIKAGADIVIAPSNTFRESQRIVAAVKNGELPETTLDGHVRRILFYKYLTGVRSDGDEGKGENSSLRIPLTDSISKLLTRQ